ncbi:MAG: YaeQ family protein [Halioglobus sp.]
MALKPTIHKAQIELADSDRNHYESLSLTLAQHPSETSERMMARLVAFCLNHEYGLSFTRGISTTDEPDIWCHSDSDELLSWIEVGQPDEARLRKACGRSRTVLVYAFGSGASTWWKINGDAISALPHTEVWQFPWEAIVALTRTFLSRNLRLSVSIAGGTLYVDDGNASLQLTPARLTPCD